LSKELIGRNPVLYPCTSPPKPWNGWRDGGYHDERTRASVSFVKGKAARNKETEQDFRTAFRNGSVKLHVDGVNQLQSVPFKINEHVLDALKRHGRKLLEEKFRNRSQKLVGKKLGGAERQLEQDKLQLERDIAIAERFKGAPFYVPLNCDFRGRVFPIPHFNHYRGDHIRSLFMFHDGMRLGNNEKYLMDHTATRGGFEGVDKKSLHDRRKWCDDNLDLIERTAKLESEEWTKAENPVGFLAACKELVEARAAGADYITHLPIEVDASCSVLQHYCLMLRSEKARLVNLGACATANAPEDNYGNTVQLVVAGVAEDPELEAALRDVSLDRKAMKRPQMTDGYNSTTYGKAQQFESEFADRGQMVEWKYLRGLAEVTEDVIAKHFREVQEAKDFLRRCADAT
jgi:DNA-directed RNA polymerase